MDIICPQPPIWASARVAKSTEVVGVRKSPFPPPRASLSFFESLFHTHLHSGVSISNS